MTGILDECKNIVSTLIGSDREHESLSSWSGKITPDTPVHECRFVAFDMEMSGLDHKKDFIVSLGAIEMRGSTIQGGKAFSRLVRPEGTMNADSVVIHQITPDDLREGADIKHVLADFLEFIEDAVLVGHFLHFDLRFLNVSLKKHFRTKLKNPALDTHDLHEWLSQNSADFKRSYPGVISKKDLFSVAERYGIQVDKAHDALTDAFIAAQLFQRFLYFLKLNNIHTLEELIDIGRA